MKITLLVVGKLRDRGLRALCDDYIKRVSRHLPIDEIEAADAPTLVRRLPASGDIVALEPNGQAWSTDQLTAFIRDQMVHGSRGITFLIGGADGLPAAASARARMRLSLSKLTLPHRLARVILCEQIYRALSIIKGEPYNR